MALTHARLTTTFEDLYGVCGVFEALVRAVPSRVFRLVCKTWKTLHDEVFTTHLDVSNVVSLSWVGQRFFTLESLVLRSSYHPALVVDRMPALRSLTLGVLTKVSDHDLYPMVCAWTALTTLNLAYNTHVTDIGLKHVVSTLTHLHTLDISGCRHIRGDVTFPSTLRRLKCAPIHGTLGAPCLVALEWTYASWGAPVSAHHAALVNGLAFCLQELRLRTTFVDDDAWYTTLRKLTNLTRLDMGPNRVDDLYVFTTLSKLTAFRADYAAGIDGASVLGLRNVRDLHLRSCGRMTDSGLHCLAKITNLVSLRIEMMGSSIHEDGLKSWTSLVHLERVEMYGCVQLFDDMIQRWTRAWTALRVVDFSGSVHLTDETLAAMPCTLRGLSLYGCFEITDRGLVHLRKCTQLESLNLSWSKITDDGLEDVANAWISLSQLRLYGCRGVTASGVRHALRALPRRVLWRV